MTSVSRNHPILRPTDTGSSYKINIELLKGACIERDVRRRLWFGSQCQQGINANEDKRLWHRGLDHLILLTIHFLTCEFLASITGWIRQLHTINMFSSCRLNCKKTLDYKAESMYTRSYLALSLPGFNQGWNQLKSNEVTIWYITETETRIR